MNRHVLGWVVVFVLLLGGMAYAAPGWFEDHEARIATLETQVADLQARVAALEGGASSSTTTTLGSTSTSSSTTTTLPTTTSTAPTSSTTTLPPTSTSTTVLPTTTTTPPSVTSAPPSTTTPSEVLTLTADLVITEDFAFSGHIEGNGHAILIDGADVTFTDFTINNVERIMWQGACGVGSVTNGVISDSGGPSQGEYPIHVHLCGDASRGLVIQGVTVVNGAHHAFVVHGSHGVSLIDTVARNTKGDPYWWDPPGSNETCSFQKLCTLDNSNDTLIDGALCDGVTNGPGDDRGFRLSCFVLGAGSGNIIVNSHAQRVQPSHVVDCSGYHWPESANQNVGGNVWIFENNTFSDSPCHGIFVWQNDGNHHIVDGFSGGGIDHGAYSNLYEYVNVDVPYFEIHAVGWSAHDSSLGDVIVRRHTLAGDAHLDRVQIDSLTMLDGIEAINPIHLFITETNLICGEITWTNPHPESLVSIDGLICERP